MNRCVSTLVIRNKKLSLLLSFLLFIHLHNFIKRRAERLSDAKLLDFVELSMKMTSFSLQLTTAQKDQLDDVIDEVKQFDWEIGEYLFHDFVEYFQLPQIIRVSQPWDTNLVKNDVLFLHSSYDRHLILARAITPDNRVFVLPDWFQGPCRVLAPNPIYKSRWWEFRSVLELLRFQMPRPHIRLLQDTPVLLHLPTNQTIPVLLKEGTEVTLKAIEKAQHITNGKEMFVLVDKNDQEFLLDPTSVAESFHFATKILDNEFDQSYHKNTAETTFSLPEILIRYELPLEIEIVNFSSAVPIENFPHRLRLEKYAIGKSVIAFSIGDSNHPRILEFSSMTQFSLQCIRCLTTGLPRDSSIYEETQAFDAIAYRQYETARDRLGQLFDDAAMQYIRTPFVANRDEIEAIEKVFDIGKQLKNEETTQTYVLIDQQGTSSTPTPASVISTASISKHPARFTVHLPADLNNPYSSVMEVDDGEEHETPAAMHS